MAKNFNPYGLHAIHIPLALLRYDGAAKTGKGLSWGAKVLYGRLALFLGRPKPKAESFCNPSLETMASATATSMDTVGRWLTELVDHGFIERVRKGRGPAECVLDSIGFTYTTEAERVFAIPKSEARGSAALETGLLNALSSFRMHQFH